MTDINETTIRNNIRVCYRCIIDETVPRSDINKDGVCRYCRLYDQLNKEFPLNESGNARFDRLISDIKRRGRKKKFDCVVGISGGRDSTYTLYLAKSLGLRPLAVHFNDGFGNPVAGDNMRKVVEKLDVELRTVTSDWRESKDLRVAFLRASVPDLNIPTDVGIAATLYGVARKENVKYIFIGHSFRTEGVAAPEWSCLDGRYMRAIHKKFGKYPLQKWTPTNPGYNLGLREIVYYTILCGIRTITPLYHVNYVRSEVDEFISRELGWQTTGAHYLDDLSQALLAHVIRLKHGIDRRQLNYGALVYSGQMSRQEAFDRMEKVYQIEDPKLIDLCIKRLGLAPDEFEEIMNLAPKNYRDYPNNVLVVEKSGPILDILSRFHLVPRSAYFKYCMK